jgi:outer membrane immunogenic protein
MKKFLLATAALLSIVSTASAADLGARTYTKAPPMVSPATNWSGFYIGAMGGYGWSGNSDGTDLKGGFGGGTIGYNWQMPGSQFVFGIEADAAAAGLSDSATVAGVTAQDKINALGSVTGRLGLAVDSALFYIKGGYAWADNKFSVTSGALSLSDSHTHSGWTLGTGLEYMFAPSWSAKAEYMYADFGSANYFANVIPGGIDSGHQQVHTIKAGINYHFNWGGPAVARY